MNTIEIDGDTSFRSSIILGTLSGKRVHIKNYRNDTTLIGDDVGLRDYEVAFLKCVQAFTNGTNVRVNDTGTDIIFEPGIIYGGDSFDFSCPLDRGIGYYLEMLMVLAPFAKYPTSILLRGLTDHEKDISVDSLRILGCNVLRKFGLPTDKSLLQVSIEKRGWAPLGGALVRFQCPLVTRLSLSPGNFISPGLIKRIRGVASCGRVSPQTAMRLSESAKSLLVSLLPDININLDVRKGQDAGLSPGFSLSLIAESTNGVLYHADGVAGPGVTPEDLGAKVAQALLSKILSRTTVDPSIAWLYFILTALGPQHMSHFAVLLDPFAIQTLRELKRFFGIIFHLEPLQNTSKSSSSTPSESTLLKATCLGIDFTNLAARSN